MRIKKIPRGRPYIPFSTLLKALFQLPFDSLKQGKQKKDDDEILAKFFSRKYLTTLSTCRMAFFQALRALGLKPGDEILLTPITIPDMVNAIHILGLTPVFVDINPKTHFFDYEDLSRKITGRSRAILFTYLSGIVPDLNHVLSISTEHNLFVIEDISHNYNTTFESRLLGTFGDVAVGSTCITKSLSSLGGGFLMTDKEGVFNCVKDNSKNLFVKPEKSFLFSQVIANIVTLTASNSAIFSIFTYNVFRLIRRLRPNVWEYLETFSRDQSENAPLYDNPAILRTKLPREAFFWFSDLQANVLIRHLEKVKECDTKRIKLFETFSTHLNEKTKAGLVEEYAGVHQSTYWHIPFMADDKLKLKDFLFDKGIDAIGFMMKNCAHEKAFKIYYSHCPGAEKVLKETILLPIHSSFTDKDMVHIAQSLNQYYEGTSVKRGRDV